MAVEETSTDFFVEPIVSSGNLISHEYMDLVRTLVVFGCCMVLARNVPRALDKTLLHWIASGILVFFCIPIFLLVYLALVSKFSKSYRTRVLASSPTVRAWYLSIEDGHIRAKRVLVQGERTYEVTASIQLECAVIHRDTWEGTTVRGRLPFTRLLIQDEDFKSKEAKEAFFDYMRRYARRVVDERHDLLEQIRSELKNKKQRSA